MITYDRAGSVASVEPVFLLGFQRSGTTLLRLMLDAHPALAIPFESFVLIDFFNRCNNYDLARADERARLSGDLVAAKGISAWQPSVALSDIDLDACTSYAAAVNEIFTAYARRCGKRIWGDKTPSYTSELHVLNALFPRARFVHLIRDGRDVALSIVRQSWGPSDLLTALDKWAEVVGWVRRMGTMLPSSRYLEVRYEELVADPTRVLTEITSFLDLPFDPAMLERGGGPRGKLPEASMAFHRNLSRPVDSTLAYEWRTRLSATDQVLALKIAGPVLTELGYQVDAVSVSGMRVAARHTWHVASAASRWRIRRALRPIRQRLRAAREQ